MKLTVRVPELPEGVEIDATRLSKALRWALADGWEPGAVWQVNNVPAIAQLEELVFQDGQAGLSELFEAVSKQLGLPSNADTLSLLAKGRLKGQPQPGQLGFSFDEEKHPRLPAGGTQGEYKPGEFVPKEKALTSVEDATKLIRAWGSAIGRGQQHAWNHVGGTRKLDLGEARAILEQLQRDNAQYEEELFPTPPEKTALAEATKAHAGRAEKELQAVVNQLEEHDARRKAEPVVLTPEQRVTFHFQGWSDTLHHAREQLARHLTGEEPMSRANIERSAEHLRGQFEYYESELTAASRNPENKDWFTTSQDHRLMVLGRLSRTTLGNYLSEMQRRRAEDFMPWHQPGWEEMLQQASQLEEDATIAGHYYDWAAEHKSDAEGWDAGRDLRQKADDTRRDLNAKAKKLRAKANKEKRETAKFFKEQPNTGAGFTRQQKAYEPDLSMKVRWRWVDLTGQVQGSGASAPMAQEKWDAIQDKHPMPGLPPNFFYMGPTDTRNVVGEANYAAKRFVDRVPSWLMNRIADNGGEYIFSAPPPYRLGFKTQAEYDEWIGKQPGKSIKDNDPRHWDDVGGFYRHADKKAYSQVGESGQRGTVDLELHEFGHMVDYLFNGGAGGRKGAVSASPEFMSIWKNLHPWLDNYMTKDHDAAELFAEGYAVFSESEENRRRMLSKESPEPMQRLGRFFERFLKEGSHEQMAKSLWIKTAAVPDRHARGRVTENGEDLRWDDGHFDEGQEERHEHFPTLFLKTPRNAEKDNNDGEQD